jgi:TRAP-type uncharacterized transport system substrate-binding protein
MKLNRRLATILLASTAILSGHAIAQQRVFFGIATGGTGGTYYPLGGMLAQLISNKAVYLTSSGVNPTLGNSDIIIYLTYRIIQE